MKQRQTREAKKPDSAWKLMRLGDVFEQRTQRGSPGLPVLSVTMDKGLVARDSVEKKMKQSLPPEESLLVQPGDIVYNTMRMWQGAVAYSDREGVVSPAYVVCRPKKDLIDGQFMHCLFKSREGQNKLQAFSHGLTEDRLRLYFDDFAEIPFRLPPLSEQKRISKILSAWDAALRTLELAIDAKERRFPALMQRLLSGDHRLPAFRREKPWSERRFGELFSERVETDREDLPLLSITATDGVVSRDSLTKKDTSAADKSCYLRICPGDIGYNTMRMWQGVSGLSELEGLISPAYTVLIPGSEIDGRFASYLLKFTPVVHLLWRHSQGLVDDTLNLKYHHFALVRAKLPTSVPEQRCIASILSTADAELRLLRQKHIALATQKRGLMQLLLTHTKRVRV